MDWIGWTGLDPTQKASPIRASSDANKQSFQSFPEKNLCPTNVTVN